MSSHGQCITCHRTMSLISRHMCHTCYQQWRQTHTPPTPCKLCAEPTGMLIRGMCTRCYQWWRYYYSDNAPEIQAKEKARKIAYNRDYYHTHKEKMNRKRAERKRRARQQTNHTTNQ